MPIDVIFKTDNLYNFELIFLVAFRLRCLIGFRCRSRTFKIKEKTHLFYIQRSFSKFLCCPYVKYVFLIP